MMEKQIRHIGIGGHCNSCDWELQLSVKDHSHEEHRFATREEAEDEVIADHTDKSSDCENPELIIGTFPICLVTKK